MYMNHLKKNSQNSTDSQGCTASMDKNGQCGEIRTLEILKEFQQLYQDKVNKIEDNCTCTSSQMKVSLLQDWVHDLTEQNTLLVKVVEELEHEASERVALLEEKLRSSSKTSYEIMKTLEGYDAQNVVERSDTLQRIRHLQSDVNNLTEFIRRIRDEGAWSVDGLHFYAVANEDLCGDMPINAWNLSKQREMEDSIAKLKLELAKSKQKQDNHEKEAKEREKMLREQSEQIEKLNNVVEQCTSSMPDRQRLIEELHELRVKLKLKSDDFAQLEKSVKDIREALTAEVADKHDNIVALRRECQLLEERCRQADKQTHFKDDIIKEMRKELKQIRSKFDVDEEKKNEETNKKIQELDEENKKLNNAITEVHDGLNMLHNLLDRHNRNQHQVGNLTDEKSKGDAIENLSLSDKEILKVMNILKTDVTRIINFNNNPEMSTFKRRFDDVENMLQEIKNKDLLIKNKDEMIKIQTDSLNVAQQDLDDLRNKLTDIEKERDTRLQEVCNLQHALKLNQSTIEELEKALRNSEEKSTNLQQVATLYVDTIQMLESTKNKADLEIEQQRVTIGNLQQALVNTKHQLEEVQSRSMSDVSVASGWTSRWTGSSSKLNARRSVHDV